MSESERYDHASIEAKQRKRWEEEGTYRTGKHPERPKFYALDMFPYPSGQGLHVGHPKGFIGSDVLSRFKRMNGFDVLHPMGFDAFGLPAENYAIKNKVHPRQAVDANIAYYKSQLSIIGFDYDWTRQIDTTDPKYYKWTQWIFLKLYEKGLAFQSYEPINWCPSCQTGLANEDIEDGKCERCETPVEKKPMRQWVLKITDYADRLLEDLDELDWPESIKESQRNWIGRSEGHEIDFKLEGANVPEGSQATVFTTRADTLFGVTYIVLAPEHPLVATIAGTAPNRAAIDAYVAAARELDVIERTAEGKEKSGVCIEGVFAINPVNQERVSVWIADYVLADYGTGAVMAVPAHDERDYAFATKHNLEIRHVVRPHMVDAANPHVEGQPLSPRNNAICIIRHKKTGKYLCLKWKEQPWTTFVIGGIEDGEDVIEAAKREIAEEAGIADATVVRVLGAPIQTDYNAAHKKVNRRSTTTAILFETESDPASIAAEELAIHEPFWMDESELKSGVITHAEIDVLMNRIRTGNDGHYGDGFLVASGEFDGLESTKAISVIGEKFGRTVVRYKLRDWVFSRQRYWGEPIPLLHVGNEVVPVPEDQLPVELPRVESYAPTGTGESPLADIAEWVNTTAPDGRPARRETNTMPQWAGSSWYYLRYMDTENDAALVSKDAEERFAPVDVYVGGTEHATRHLIYARFWHKFLFDIGVVSTKEPFKRLMNQGLIMGEDGRKMGKRYGNVVNPDDVVAQHGADTFRMFEMFLGPFEQQANWSTASIMGPRRFIERLWKMQDTPFTEQSHEDVRFALAESIPKINADIEAFAHNTAISCLMILLSTMEKAPELSKDDYMTLLKLVAPYAPHVTDEIWGRLGGEGSIHESAWPTPPVVDASARPVAIAVQVNGKSRGAITARKGATQEELVALIEGDQSIAKWLVGERIRIIHVPDRMISFVIKQAA